MLVLSRKEGESIVIDGGIRVFITKIKGNQVRIGIEAPAEVSVRRSEITRNAPASSRSPGVKPLRTPLKSVA